MERSDATNRDFLLVRKLGSTSDSGDLGDGQVSSWS